MRRECTANHVRGVGVRPAVGRWPEAALGIGLQHDAGEVRDGAIDRVDSVLPERGDPRIERIERIEAAERFRAAEINRDRNLRLQYLAGQYIDFLLKEGQGMGAAGYRDHIVVCGWNTTARDLIEELKGDEFTTKVVLLADPQQRKFSGLGLLIVALGIPVYLIWRRAGRSARRQGEGR